MKLRWDIVCKDMLRTLHASAGGTALTVPCRFEETWSLCFSFSHPPGGEGSLGDHWRLGAAGGAPHAPRRGGGRGGSLDRDPQPRALPMTSLRRSPRGYVCVYVLHHMHNCIREYVLTCHLFFILHASELLWGQHVGLPPGQSGRAGRKLAVFCH